MDTTERAPAPVAAPAGELAISAPNLAPPPGNPRFPLFDSLRAIAALSVFLGHTVTGLYTFLQHPHLFLIAVQVADQGVAVFFLISGFLLYRPFVAARTGGRRMSLRGFARRRLLRIVPAYWVALTIGIVTGVVFGVTVHNFWIFYGFGQIYSATTIGQGIGAAWTLCIEMTFYALLPLLSLLAARLTHRRGAMAAELGMLAALAVASLAFRAHFSSFSDFAIVSTLPGTFCWFAVGMGLAVISVAGQRRTERLGPGSPEPRTSMPMTIARDHPTVCWAAALAAFILLHELALHTRGTFTAVAEHVLYAVVAMFILLPGIFGDNRGGLARRVLRNRLLTWIGLVSYAFYLYHTLVIQQIAKGLHSGSGAMRYVLLLVSSFLISSVCAGLSYYLLERPIMRLRRSPASRERPAVRS